MSDDSSFDEVFLTRPNYSHPSHITHFVENTPSNQTRCRICAQNLVKGDIRIRTVDRSLWAKYGRHAGGEGASRGYIECAWGTINRNGDITYAHMACLPFDASAGKYERAKLDPSQKKDVDSYLKEIDAKVAAAVESMSGLDPAQFPKTFSGSNGASYTVKLVKGLPTCNCPGYAFNKSTPKKCKHIDEVTGVVTEKKKPVAKKAAGKRKREDEAEETKTSTKAKTATKGGKKAAPKAKAAKGTTKKPAAKKQKTE